MNRGKHTCRILKQIRKQIADANGIEYVVSECKYQGECLSIFLYTSVWSNNNIRLNHSQTQVYK